MPVEVRWYDERQTLIYFRYEGRWTWEDFYAAVDASRAMLDSVDHVVDIIVDMQASAGIPSGDIITHFRYMARRFEDPRVGQTVIIGMRALVRITSDIMRRLYRHDRCGTLRMAQDMDEALAILAQYRTGS